MKKKILLGVGFLILVLCLFLFVVDPLFYIEISKKTCLLCASRGTLTKTLFSTQENVHAGRDVTGGLDTDPFTHRHLWVADGEIEGRSTITGVVFKKVRCAQGDKRFLEIYQLVELAVMDCQGEEKKLFQNQVKKIRKILGIKSLQLGADTFPFIKQLNESAGQLLQEQRKQPLAPMELAKKLEDLSG